MDEVTVTTTAGATATPEARRGGLGRAGPVAVFATAWPIMGSVATAASAPFVAPWLRGLGTTGVAVFVVALALLGGVALAPTYATSALAGWTFGFRVGFPAVLGGTAVGAALCYVLAKRAAGERVAATFREHPKWEVVRRALVEANAAKTLWIVVLLRLSPVLPFGTTNVLLATTGVRPPTYLAGTLLGLAPRTGLVTLAAAGAERLEMTGSTWLLVASGAAATALCIGTLAVVGKRALDRATHAAGGATAEAD